MSFLAVVLIAVIVLAAGAVVWTLWVRPARRERARLLHGTADLHAIATEDKYAQAIAAERNSSSEAEAARAARLREEAEAEFEEVAREGERARTIDPDVETEPDPNAPRL